ncbi:MAG: HAD family hydrolase [Halocynthiibacter sp.]
MVFDKDGTLFGFADTWEGWATRLFEELSGGDPGLAEDLGARVGFDMRTGQFRADSVVISKTPDEIAANLVAALPGSTPASLVRRMNKLAEKVRVCETVPLAPYLDRLATAGLKLGLATNDAESPARANLDQVGVTGRFDFIAGYDSGFGAKPGPGMLQGFARSMGLSCKDVVMVGDSVHDLQSGRAAGAAAVAVLTGPAVEADLAPHADVVLPDIGYLPQWLGL